ncbi:uncharacterized protein LOC120104394 [Phoenix dactylifera]|uniref:Uncharacterized protein LOC120104394 n=1 Tax=Phoenix dactylifera TaxID=42345 RepID=A0A8B8ZB74_PHODC|nr:uncharacterized protein LOC120104394 [Phoenix dactylifera]
MEEEDVEEALKLKEEIETTMEEIKESELYINLRNQLVNDPEVRDNVIRVLGSHESIQMVIYGIGSAECSFDSQYQLALALLLREDSCLPIGDIEIYDPVLSQADIKAYSDLRCKVLLINEQCRRRVEKPTLFFIPGLMVWLVGNLLEVTFDPKQLNQMILIDTIGRGRLETLDQLVTEGPSGLAVKVLEHEERERFRWVIRNYVNKEISFDYYDKCYFLSELKLSFFNVGPNVDMKSFLPSVSMKQRFKSDYFVAKEHRNTLIFDRLAYYHMYAEVRYMEPFTEDFYDPYLDRSCLPSSPDEKWSYIYGHIRGPARYRRIGFEPQKGWVKLNFSGFSHGKEVPAGFGGVVHDEHDNLVVSYAGPLRDVDFTMASVEALRRGLRCLIDLNFSPLPKLIIEGDALSIIRWVNRRFPPPERATKAFEEIYVLISDVECVISYVHEEANHKAVELAKKGAKLHKFQIWEHQRKVI